MAVLIAIRTDPTAPGRTRYDISRNDATRRMEARCRLPRHLDDPRRRHRDLDARRLDAHLHRRCRDRRADPAGDVGHHRRDDGRRRHERAVGRTGFGVHRRGADPHARPGAAQRAAAGGRRPARRRDRGADPPALGPRRQLRPLPGRAGARPGHGAALCGRAGPVLPQGVPRPAVGLGHAAVPRAEPCDGRRGAGPPPGLRIVPAPGHTPGSQALVVDTEHGSFCIAGDAISTYGTSTRTCRPATTSTWTHRWTRWTALRVRWRITSCRRTTTASSRTVRSRVSAPTHAARRVARLMLALRKITAGGDDAVARGRARPRAGPGPGAHRGHRRRHVRHRPAHPAR